MDPSTLAVTLGRAGRAPGAPVNRSVELSATYHAGGDHTYGRDANRGWEAFEEVVGVLEGGRALVFASGLAATSAVVETLPVGAVVAVQRDAYNGTRRLLADLESRKRVVVRSFDPGEVDVFDGAALVWLESPSNPLLNVVDLRTAAEAGRRAGAIVAVDNTFATPLLQQPLSLGAHVVVHSATKLLSGHSDVVMGVTVAGSDEMYQALVTRRGLHGAIPGPMETFLALRGLRTLPVRLERAQSSANVLASRLGAHPAVECVRYPGSGTMVSFDVRGGGDAAERVCSRVKVAVHATSLGGVETLVERRAHRAFEEHVPAGLIRMSVGLEHVEDLWSDLAQALD